MKRFTFKPAWIAMLTTALALTLLFAACPTTTNSTEDTTPPAGVTILDAALGVVGEVTLTWTDPEDADFHHVEIAFSPVTEGVAQPITVLKGVQSKIIADLTGGTSYTFTVIAVDASGNKSSAATVYATPAALDNKAPDDVTGLAATAGNGQITLNWTDPVDTDGDFHHVEITFSPAATDVAQPISVARGAQRGTVKGLANDTPYTFIVKAVDASGNESDGVTETATPDGTIENDIAPPADVGSLAVSKAENGQVILTWTDPANDDLAFIKITFSPGGTEPIIVAKGTLTGTITGLANGTEYTFTVKAVDTFDNESVDGATVTTTPLDTVPPANASGLFATPGDKQATLTWTDPADSDLAGIEITFSPAAAGVAQPITVSKGIQSKTITDLTNDTTYTFTVIAVDVSGNKNSGATTSATPVAPPSEDQTVAQLIEEGSKRLVALSLDSAVQYYESAYTKDGNNPGAIVYSSIAKLASIAKDQKVRDLVRNRFGISSYPGTIDALISGSWLVEYPEEEFVSWYYDEDTGDYGNWYGEWPQTGGLFGSSSSSAGWSSSPDWVLDESEYKAKGSGYYRQEFVKRSFVWVSDEPHYNYDWPIDNYYDPERESWVGWYDEGDNGAGYYYDDDGLVFVSSERKYRIVSYNDYNLNVYLNWYEAGEEPNGETIEKTGYHYQRYEYKLVFMSNEPIYETRGYSLFPALETPQWVKDNGAYDASLNSGNIPGAATMQLLLFSNLIDKNNNGLNNLLDQTLDAVFGANFEEAAARVAKLTYDQTVSLDETIVEAFGLTEIFGEDVVITKVEMELLIASIRLVKATLEWIDAYDWNTDLNFLKINWVNGTDGLDSLLDKIGASALPLKNNFLKDRNNGKMAASKADFIKAIDAAIGAYDNLDKEQLIPPGVKNEITGRQWIKDGLTKLKAAINGGGTFWIPGDEPVGNEWPAADGILGVNLGRLFTPGYLSIDKLVENTSGTPAIYGFPRDGGEPVAISSKEAIANYEAFGFKFKTGPIYGATGVVVKLAGMEEEAPAEDVSPLFPAAIAEVLWDLYHK
jgi:chitodextrinase